MWETATGTGTVPIHVECSNTTGMIQKHRSELIHELKANCVQRRKLEIKSPGSSVSGTSNFKLIAADTCMREYSL
ncbi:hypothetical protein JRQ81_011331 [Phrynocephalus forsythii]|uniref:Uncharacterized protein n=1 Tax=Phrynocephalus forsythii TaxID=171643 RepID=A0A9Q0X7U3_9SAUR|nr:hypothetical protein JRQ81_011331 [Phrynocephalus forsythii]